MKDTITSLANDFSLDEVLQEQASGFTELWKSEKAKENKLTGRNGDISYATTRNAAAQAAPFHAGTQEGNTD